MAVKLFQIGPRTGKLATIVADDLGFTTLYQDELSRCLVLGQYHEDGTKRVGDFSEAIGAENAFPVLDRWAAGGGRLHTWAAWRQRVGPGDLDFEGRLWNITTGDRWNLGPAFGNYPIALSGGCVAWLCDTSFTVRRVRLSELPAPRPGGTDLADATKAPFEMIADYAHGTGIVGAFALVSWDENRLSVQGLVNPHWSKGFYVGENPSGRDRNIVLSAYSGSTLDLWTGLESFKPRIAVYDPDHIAVVTSGGPGVRMAIFEADDLEEPITNPWELAEPGTLVEDALPALFGDAPSTNADGSIICLHKNVDQAEWREIRGNDVYHLFDISRGEDRPTGPRQGWYLTPRECCRWGQRSFRSGDTFFVRGEKVEMDTGERVRWNHRITMFALKHGGVMIQFDPRFEGLDYGPEKLYEKHFNSPRFGVRWEAWCTPKDVRGVLPWGDSRHDVLVQQAQAEPAAGGTTPPYRECPRRSVDDDPKRKETPVEQPDIQLPSDDQTVNALARIHIEGYLGHLQRARGIFDSPSPESTFLKDPTRTNVYVDDRSISVWQGRYTRYFVDHALRNPGADHHEPAIRNVLRDIANSHEAREKRKPAETKPGQINGRLRVERGRLRNDAGFYNYQGISAFPIIGHYLQGREYEAHDQVEMAIRYEKDLRVFAMLEPFNNAFGPVTAYTPDTPGWETAAKALIERANAAGRYVQMNLFADCAPAFGHTLYPSWTARAAVLRKVATMFRDWPGVWFRLANEPYQNGFTSAVDPQLLDLADELANTLGHRDFAIGDVPDDGSESGSTQQRDAIAQQAGYSTILVSHNDRTEQPGRERPAEHMKSVHETYESVAPQCALIFDEPRGFASVRQPGRRDNRAGIALLECATAAILGRGYTYHRIAEQDPAAPGLEESRAAHQIPTSPDYVFTNAGLGGSWVGRFDGFYKVRCCDNEQFGWAVGHAPAGAGVAMHYAEGWGQNDPGVSLVQDGLRVELRKGARR